MVQFMLLGYFTLDFSNVRVQSVVHVKNMLTPNSWLHKKELYMALV